MSLTFVNRVARKVYRTLFRIPARAVGFTAFNFRQRPDSATIIEAQARHAVTVGLKMARRMTGFVSIQGKTVLEVGPGHNFGPALVLACHGTVPIVADRFLAPWDPLYHPRFYRFVHEEMGRQCPELDRRPVSAVIEANGYPESVLIQEANGLETLSLPDGSLDIVVSNAVFEHLDDHLAAFRQLYRVTRPGGWGFHQVDFRFHVSFDRPLEHLLMSPEEFERHSRACLRESGTYLRPHEMTALFRQCGFTVEHVKENAWAEPAYLEEFLPRLRNSPASAHRDTPVDVLRQVGGLYRIRKPR